MNPPALSFKELPADRILVVAPHPDDESLGCGGLLWHFQRLNREVHFAFVTDGGASHPNSPTWPRHRLADEREKEAEKALFRLGHAHSVRHFMRLRDADMPMEGSDQYATALATAADIVLHARPDLVILPWRRDPHRDHRDAWKLFTEAVAQTGLKPSTMEYAIWLDELGTPQDRPEQSEMERINFHIGEAEAAKRQAVEAHLTQTGHVITDDEQAFCLKPHTIDRLVGPIESYWRPLP
ncbi:PIG-L family deacetylase [Aureimonas fodinaquatilis]|uniref:PIG-L family deacetylase n=1 Tax=Aureimonas fodinaquatilis TaxID=2565783 RepID=A0A5B0DZS7_9HYPH|nr:PIG-L family deacetylase [Aureimonas fodinaquatilis]KAA0970719.1 PIG-L family deacetylase [Aureimonas fodinaquatilis]